MSVPERLDLLCRTDREVALRAVARYIDLLFHHLVNVHVYISLHVRWKVATEYMYV